MLTEVGVIKDLVDVKTPPLILNYLVLKVQDVPSNYSGSGQRHGVENLAETVKVMVRTMSKVPSKNYSEVSQGTGIELG